MTSFYKSTDIHSIVKTSNDIFEHNCGAISSIIRMISSYSLGLWIMSIQLTFHVTLTVSNHVILMANYLKSKMEFFFLIIIQWLWFVCYLTLCDLEDESFCRICLVIVSVILILLWKLTCGHFKFLNYSCTNQVNTFLWIIAIVFVVRSFS